MARLCAVQVHESFPEQCRMATDSSSALNPYALLGVSVHSTCQEVRRRYYDLACICHPDRGGTADQMRTLHNAYQFVARGNALTGKASLEDLQTQFDEFCTAQHEAPPAFIDIHADEHQRTNFHAAFEASAEIDSAFAPGGYDTAPSEYTHASSGYVPCVSGAVDAFDRQVMVFTDPSPAILPRAAVRDLTDTPLDDFSTFVGNMHVSDYREGLSSPPQLDVAVDESLDVVAEFHRRRAQEPVAGSWCAGSW